MTPGGKFAIIGSAGKNLSLYEVDKQILSGKSSGTASSFDTYAFDSIATPNHKKPITNIVFNPKYMMFAAASQNIVSFLIDLYNLNTNYFFSGILDSRSLRIIVIFVYHIYFSFDL